MEIDEKIEEEVNQSMAEKIKKVKDKKIDRNTNIGVTH